MSYELEDFGSIETGALQNRYLARSAAVRTGVQFIHNSTGISCIRNKLIKCRILILFIHLLGISVDGSGQATGPKFHPGYVSAVLPLSQTSLAICQKTSRRNLISHLQISVFQALKLKLQPMFHILPGLGRICACTGEAAEIRRKIFKYASVRFIPGWGWFWLGI